MQDRLDPLPAPLKRWRPAPAKGASSRCRKRERPAAGGSTTCRSEVGFMPVAAPRNRATDIQPKQSETTPVLAAMTTTLSKRAENAGLLTLDWNCRAVTSAPSTFWASYARRRRSARPKVSCPCRSRPPRPRPWVKKTGGGPLLEQPPPGEDAVLLDLPRGGFHRGW